MKWPRKCRIDLQALAPGHAFLLWNGFLAPSCLVLGNRSRSSHCAQPSSASSEESSGLGASVEHPALLRSFVETVIPESCSCMAAMACHCSQTTWGCNRKNKHIGHCNIKLGHGPRAPRGRFSAGGVERLARGKPQKPTCAPARGHADRCLPGCNHVYTWVNTEVHPRVRSLTDKQLNTLRISCIIEDLSRKVVFLELGR